MDELTQMLSGILDSPEGMEKIKSIANSLLSEEKKEEEQSNPLEIMNGISPKEISGIMSVVKSLKKQSEDSKTKLLMSLRPYLSSERQKRLDDAVKILRLIDMMPLIKKAGLF